MTFDHEGPERVAVLTFDDGHKSDHAFVAPTLERLGFGGTFFITEGLGALENKRFYLTWEEVRELHEAGFEVGNHTQHHLSVRDQTRPELAEELRHIERRCAEHGIPRPTTFAYPGYQFDAAAVEVVRELGYAFARRGVDPEYSMRNASQGEDISGLGRPAYWDPATDHPLLVPTTVDAGWYWSPERFRRVVTSAPAGTVPILTFHGIPAVEHPWVTVEPDAFLEFMHILADAGFRGIALRDLAELHGKSAPDAEADASTGREVVAAIETRRRVNPTELRTEHAQGPIGVGERRPWLSWVPASSRRAQAQRAAQVLVARDAATLAAGSGDVWDSGRVLMSDATGLRYDGPALESMTTYHWTVRLWDGADRISTWAPAASFEMGPLEAGDWGGAWIAADADASAPLLRTDVHLPAPVLRARAHVVGLGYHELHVNGTKADDRVLAPAPSFFDDGLVKELGLGPVPRTKWASYDLTKQLREGDNAVGVMLGNGWYSIEPDIPRSPYHRDPYDDRPVLLVELRIELTDGETVTVVSGPDWRTHAGPISYNDYCNGEEYDARLEQDDWSAPAFDAFGWKPVTLVEGPSGPPAGQRTPPQRVIETITPVDIDVEEPERRLFDAGQNLTGWVRIRVRGEAGSTVTIRHAARLDGKGQLDDASNMADGCTARQTDRYTLRGGGTETWEPRFTLHGFAIIETITAGKVTVEAIEARVVHSDVDRIGSFGSSEPLLDRIQANTTWSFRSAMQGFIQGSGDRCERLGWLGDPGFLADNMFLDFQTASFWADWLDDIADAQMPDGAVPIVAPPHWHAPWGGRPNDFAYQPWPDWMATYAQVVWQHYRAFGEVGIFERHHDGIKRLADWMSSQATEHILSIGLGDHMEPQPDGLSSHSPKLTPIELTSTAWYYETTRIVAASAAALGKDDDAERYEHLAQGIRTAFNRRFFDRKTGRYGPGNQTSNALPLMFGMAPRGREADVTADLVADVRARGDHLWTGIMGTTALEKALPANGAAGAMYDVMMQTTYPSWGHQIELEATTLWETWADDPPGMSLNIYMFGATPAFLYGDVAGIAAASPGWRDIAIAPKLTARLDAARASIRTPRGVCAIEWRRVGSDLTFELEIPATSRAEVLLPTGELWDVAIFEGDHEIWRDGRGFERRPGVTSAKRGHDHVALKVGGGIYIFRVRPLPAARVVD